MSKGLKKLMKKIVATDANEQLAVADAKLGNAIKSKTDLDCVYSSNVAELMRCIRSQMPELVSGGDEKVIYSRNYVETIPPDFYAVSFCKLIFNSDVNFSTLGNDRHVSWTCSFSLKI